MIAGTAEPRSTPSATAWLLGFLAIWAATVLATLVGNGSITVAIAPLAAAVALWAMWVVPLRKTLFFLLFLALALDKPGDAAGLWQSPVAPLGRLLSENLDKTTGLPGLKISLLVLLVGYLLIVRAHRVVVANMRDHEGLTIPSTLSRGLLLSLMTVVLTVVYGIVRGGDVQMIKIQLQTFIPLLAMAYLLSVSLRGPEDYKTLGWIVVVAAMVKSLLAVWVRSTVPQFVGNPPRELEYATNHGDSMLFACAFVILVTCFLEKPARRTMGLLLVGGGVIVAGLIANDRRLAWVQIAAPVATLLLLNPRGPVTRRICKAGFYVLPLIVLYVAVGWNSHSRIFAPLQTFRTMEDETIDRSTWFRDVENYNLIYTFAQHPILGTGFGHPFEQAVENDDISEFKEYPYMPHNSILGLWAFTGAVGFCGIWMVFLIGLMFAMRSYEFSSSPEFRVAAAGAITGIIAYVIHCWGDIGFTEAKSIFFAGGGLAVAGRLAVLTGAWTSRRARQPAIGAR